MQKDECLGKTTNGIVLQYDKLLQDGYVLEAGEGATFVEQYKQATQFVCDIVNQAAEKNKNELCDKAHLRRCAAYQQHCNNVIAFMGSRGTGKTSAMLSFLCALENCFDNGINTQVFPYQTLKLDAEEQYRVEHTKFVTLNCIDAGALIARDDVVEIILARMLNTLRERVGIQGYQARFAQGQQEDLRELYKRFDSLFRNLRYLNVGDVKEIPEGESALRTLQNLSSSQSVIREFSELVEKYLDFFDRNQTGDYCNERSQSFLVVALDDIDRCGRYGKNKKCGTLDVYTLLEQVYDYLMIPRIIVLVTSTEQLLRRGCLTHLETKYGGSNSSTKGREQREQKQLQELTTQFITKILPTYHHIHMPEFQNALWMGRDGTDRICVFVGEDYVKEIGGESILTTKDFALKLIAKRTGVFYDASGIKVHFFEQKNLRDAHDFLKIMASMDTNTDEQKVLEENRKKLIDYITGIFYLEKVCDAEATFFERLLHEPIDRRSKLILDEIRRKKHVSEDITGGFSYGYGELIYNLYLSTRMNIFSKELVHCILALYSVELSQLYSSCRYGELVSSNMARKELSRTIGASIAGRLTNNMLPAVYYNRIDRVSGTRTPISSRSCWAQNVGNISKVVFVDVALSKDKASLGREIREMVVSVEMIWMFFTNERQIGSLQPPIFVIKEVGSRLHLEADGGLSGCFNIFNFCVNSFNYEDFFDKIEERLVQAFEKYFQDMYKVAGIQMHSRQLRALIRESSMREEYEEWERKYGCLALPVHQFDMTYNILKRLADKTLNDMPNEIESKDMLSYCIELYKNVQKKLKEQSEYYKNVVKKVPDSQPFEVTFGECPFIKRIGANMADDEEVTVERSSLNKRLKQFLENIAKIGGDSGRTILQSD